MKLKLSPKKKINHVAIIMDGNGRWAKKNNYPKKVGHEFGIKNCISICVGLKNIKYSIKEISFYVFSTENWKRKPSEINNLFNLIDEFYSEFKDKADRNNLSSKYFRVINEIPTILLILIVFFAILKPLGG